MTPLEPRDLAQRCAAAFRSALLVFGVMGGLYFGIFTDTESAAVGAIGAFLFAVWRGKLKRGAFWR